MARQASRAGSAPMPAARPLVDFSAAVLRVHESKTFRGGVIASLSIPWGFAKGDDDLGGYHLVWPRDLVETAGGFLAVGAHDDARRVLRFLRVTQDADGHWCQNMWLDGSPYWNGIQMDETALPILLVDLAARRRARGRPSSPRYWPMVRRAAALHRPQRPGEPAGSLGGGPRLLAVHARRRDRGAARRGRRRRRQRRAGGCRLPARDRRRLERLARRLDLRQRHGTGASGAASTATTCASRSRIRRTRRRRRTASCRSRTVRRREQRRARRLHGQPGRARAGALRAARRRRSAHRRTRSR